MRRRARGRRRSRVAEPSGTLRHPAKSRTLGASIAAIERPRSIAFPLVTNKSEKEFGQGADRLVTRASEVIRHAIYSHRGVANC